MKKAAAVYFSATGNTKKNVVAMAKATGLPVEQFDLTKPNAASPAPFDADTFVVIGAPVYGGRIPNVARERFEALRGDNTLCVVVGSYGNREYEDALVELEDMMNERGFKVVGGAAVIGRHTFGEVQLDRPNEADLAECGEFIKAVLAKGEDAPAPQIAGNRPYKEGMKGGGHFHPLTGEGCVGCGICVKNCPVGAIADDFATVSDACISCFRCIRNCPVGAKNSDYPEANKFAAMITERLKVRKENAFFL